MPGPVTPNTEFARFDNENRYGDLRRLVLAEGLTEREVSHYSVIILLNLVLLGLGFAALPDALSPLLAEGRVVFEL